MNTQMPDLILGYNNGEPVAFTSCSARGDEFLQRAFACVPDDMDLTSEQMMGIANIARRAGLVIG